MMKEKFTPNFVSNIKWFFNAYMEVTVREKINNILSS